MKYFPLVSVLTATAIASPVDLEAANPAAKRQSGGIISNDLQSGPCRPITFIFARGSTEPGNMGSTVGPATCSDLRDRYGSSDVACQGVGGAYQATVAGNLVQPYGTTLGAIREAQDMFELAHSKCPDSVVVAGGYSQGAAVMTAAVGPLDDDVKAQVVGAVLYGDTRNAQTDGSIPGYPREDTLVLCAVGDGVCNGGLIVTPAHLSYLDDVPEATEFLGQRIDAAPGSS